MYIYIYIMVNVSNLIDRDYNNVESECFAMSRKKKVGSQQTITSKIANTNSNERYISEIMEKKEKPKKFL